MPYPREYLVGDIFKSTAAFRNRSTGEMVDPDTVRLIVSYSTVLDPTTVDELADVVQVDTYTYLTDAIVEREGVGDFFAWIPVTEAAYWHHQWVGIVGSGSVSKEGVVLVTAPVGIEA